MCGVAIAPTTPPTAPSEKIRPIAAAVMPSSRSRKIGSIVMATMLKKFDVPVVPTMRRR